MLLFTPSLFAHRTHRIISIQSVLFSEILNSALPVCERDKQRPLCSWVRGRERRQGKGKRWDGVDFFFFFFFLPVHTLLDWCAAFLHSCDWPDCRERSLANHDTWAGIITAPGLPLALKFIFLPNNLYFYILTLPLRHHFSTHFWLFSRFFNLFFEECNVKKGVKVVGGFFFETHRRKWLSGF